MIQVPLWWVFIGLGPVVFWMLPVVLRLPAIIVGSLALLAVFSTLDLAIMLILGGWVFAGFHAPLSQRFAPLQKIARSTMPFWLVLVYFVWSKYLPSLSQIIAGDGSFLDFAIPLGVSYFSFKLLHYVIEMRRENFPDHNFADFLSWLFLAPIFTAGPIERFEHYLAEREITTFQWSFVSEGTLRIFIGLVKKFAVGALVLDLLRRLGTDGAIGLSADPSGFSPLLIWATLILTLLYVYLDFSAYSDIAIGTSRLFGIRIMENFNMPFLATNLQQFWQRWHMTLANWCRTYVYMPMIGLTRNPYYAVIATFTVMGLWHAADPHWIIWGIWHGAGLAVLLHWTRYAAKRRIKFHKTKAGRLGGWALTMCYVSLGGAFTALYQQAPIWTSFQIVAAAFGMSI